MKIPDAPQGVKGSTFRRHSDKSECESIVWFEFRAINLAVNWSRDVRTNFHVRLPQRRE